MEKGTSTEREAAIQAYPQRIVCLTEETTETLYLLGEDWRIVGISGYTVRPPQARREKPKVSAFTSAKFDRIMELKPDLVFAFSDLQAEIARELIQRGLNVFTFNQRSVAEILQMILTVGRICGCMDKAAQLIARLEAELRQIEVSASRFKTRPRVFFEEWHEPLISGIRWVEELIEIAGGQPLYPELRESKAAKDRVLNPLDVAARDPQVIIASWCGRAVKKSVIRQRQGWSTVSAVRDRHVYEVKSTYILQPGPASLTEGVRQLHALIARAAGYEVDPSLAPLEALDADASASLT
ncbi:MAG TPA: cobalamin-binding protein [Pyrinomonadaceae bacterium]|jgi:iron complex transport system substrate-binding protein